MHDDETINVYAPFWAFAGAAQERLDSTVDSNDMNSNGNKAHDGGAVSATVPVAGALDKERSSSNHGSERQQPFDLMDVSVGVEEDIADRVDGFLDDFLALAGNGDADNHSMMREGGGEGCAIAEEDLAWLDDMDLAAFLPPSLAAAGGAGVEMPAASAGAALPRFSPTTEATLSSTVVVEPSGAPSGPVVSPAPLAPAVGVTSPQTGVGVVGSPVLDGVSGGEVPEVADAAPVQGVAQGGMTPSGEAHAEGAPPSDWNGLGDVAAVNTWGSANADLKEHIRRQKVARYLAKKKRRRWSKASSYQSRQRVANSRPRHKGRFLPLESEFVPIAELQRRQRGLMMQVREKAAALAAAAAPGAPSHEFGQQCSI